MKNCLKEEYDDKARINVKKALGHPFFESIRDSSLEVECDEPIDFSKLHMLVSMNMEEMEIFLEEEIMFWTKVESI